MSLPRFRTWELSLLAIIVCVGGFLRFYRLPETLLFRGDQGRDAIIAKRILFDRDIALIGPVTSVGNMYLGPLYYYFMVPFLALTYPNPVGPAYGVALVNCVTLVILYLAARQMTDKGTAFVTTFFLAVLPPAVQYSRFSWNPNVAPLFAVLLLWGLYRWWQSRSIQSLVLMWTSIGILAQLHYVSLTTTVLALAVMATDFFYRKKYVRTLTHLFLGIGIFILTQLPLIVFNFRHDQLIADQFIKFVVSPEKHMQVDNLLSQLTGITERTYLVLTGLWYTDIPRTLTQILTLICLIGITVIVLLLIRTRRLTVTPLLLTGWLATTIVGTALYSHTIFPHYLTYTYPVIVFFWAYLITSLWRSRWTVPLSVALTALVTFFSLKQLSSFTWQGLGTSVVSETVRQAAPYARTPYNLVLLSDDRDYKGMSYRYFFETLSKPPLAPEDYSTLNTLIVIDEVATPNPLSVPIYELEAARTMKHITTIGVDQGPQVLIFQKE